jgi:tetratricopeptide (TPR) repeat protein
MTPANVRGKPDFDPRFHYAIFLFRQGRLEESLRMARMVAKSWPEFGSAHYEIARILQHQDQLGEAVEELEKAIKGGAGTPAHLLLGRIFLRMGRTEEAERHLKFGGAGAR